MEYPELGPLDLQRAAAISKRLRKEHEIAFYGDVDFGRQAFEEAKWIVDLAKAIPTLAE